MAARREANSMVRPPSLRLARIVTQPALIPQPRYNIGPTPARFRCPWCIVLKSTLHSPAHRQLRSRPKTPRPAACSCGRLYYLTIEGETKRIAMCHCLACQRRTGAVISNQARFRREQVAITGNSTTWVRTAESGNALTYHFCPTCGSTVYWENTGFPGYVNVAIGNFADPSFPAPNIAVWEQCRHPWVSLPSDTPPKRRAKQG